MNISKQDALRWFTFFAQLPPDEGLMPGQQEIAYAAFTQLEEAVEARRAALRAQIPALQSLDGRTYFVGEASRFPKGCVSCLTGDGLCAVRRTNKCDAACRFCYDYGELDNIPPIGKDMWEIGGARFYAGDIDLLLSIHGKPTGVAYVYLEPFMEIAQYYPVIRAFRQAGVYQHMYTNGIAANEQSLRALGEAGLDELRFNLGATDCADGVIDKIALAKRFIPAAGVETPMTPDFYRAMLAKKRRILSTGLDFINCAELHLNPNNINNYAGESLYMYHQGYISPIWSGDLTLRLMRLAQAEQWETVVHDCSNRTKFARDLNLGAKQRGWFGASAYAREFDRIPYRAFLPALMDEDIPFLREEALPPGYRPGELAL